MSNRKPWGRLPAVDDVLGPLMVSGGIPELTFEGEL